ncbi:7-cyano-7-deazaguanine synthase QueC [Candidatus Liberibacter americanus]|uniref:7-cyano-7-deazaguanine synthase n=1 Tax=Candidatus Liberibacter americanus str. Sao Paulo TaxID=1261131 RepID=U6B8D9_9HYPH|nr:7-cyano-7-deazaguanine synthase QueC [Candidatus Liberibacter americanus]AHA28131.1 Queuosine Biosynthesis QueC ATPase [Candidatus Liberibacter americanus str. Sao Paulo]EMS36022.1 exoenzyme S synthesis protein B [Candidatus Liberibacter americanus PW_SP]
MNDNIKNKYSALLLFSGGQDSSTCLAWALNKFDSVKTIGFDYGQRNKIELKCRINILKKIIKLIPEWQESLGEDFILPLTTIGEISNSSLTKNIEMKIKNNGLPNTFVPGRNIIFLVFAAALAYRLGIKNIIAGMCETDYSGYPDCRDNTIKAVETALNLGMENNFILHTPLMWLKKYQTWQMIQDIGGKKLVDLIIEESHTCYLGIRDKRHEWGYGCDSCQACNLRKKGWIKYNKGIKL